LYVFGFKQREMLEQVVWVEMSANWRENI